MKYGFCASMATTALKGVGDELIWPAGEVGFDYIELPLAQMLALEEDELRSIKKTLEETGLPCRVCNNLFPAKLFLTGSGRDTETIRSYSERALALAAWMGASTVVFGSPGARQVPQGFDRKTAWRQLEETLVLLCERAEPYGITVAVEPICAAESNIINTVDEAAALCTRTGKGNVGPMGEFYHLRRQEDALERLAAHGDEIRHVHLANSADHSYPDQPGEDSYWSFLETLCRAGYDGTLSIEGKVKGPFVPSARRALALLRQMEAEIRQNI